MIKKPSNAINIAITITAALGAVCLVVWIIASQPPSQSSKSPTSSAYTTVVPEPTTPTTNTPSPSGDSSASTTMEKFLPTEVVATLTKTTEQFALAYSQRSWVDHTATSWLERAVPMTTNAYGDQLQKTYGKATGGLDWKDFIITKSATTATIVEAKILRSDQYDQGTVQTTITFDVTTQDGTGATTAEPLRYIKTAVLHLEAGAWKIASFENISGDPNYQPQR